MTLTAQACSDIRRWAGYSVSGDTTSQPYRELVYSNVAYASLSLDYRLTHLAAEEENTLTTVFLPALALRETEVQSASSNLDTDKAAVWTHNKSEVSDRIGLYNYLRRELCTFLGFPPGPNLGGGNRMMRC